MRDDLPYFSHDNNAQDHPKMQALIAEYGFEGYGRFWALNERIAAASEAAIDISKKVNKMSLARSLGLNETGIDQFLTYLSDPEIDLVNISPEGILTTDRTQDDYQITRESREKSRDRMRNKREKDVTPNNGDVTPNKTTDRIDRIDRSIKRERKNNDDRSDNLSSREKNPPGNNPIPSGDVSSFLDLLKTESESAGFVIPDNLAQHMAETTDPTWLSGPHSYFLFAVEQLTDQYHQNPKTKAEMRNIYMAALWKNWESFRKAYPAWREQREADARKEAVTLVRDHPPEVCPGCGKKMHGLKCSACDGFVDFQEKTLSWDFIQPGNFDFSLDKIRPGEIPKETLDI
jgi:hypothetical protein